MPLWLKKLFVPRNLTLSVSKAQKELLDLLMINKADYDSWQAAQPPGKIRLQFYYPTAVDFFYDEFKLYTAFFKRTKKGDIELLELKMTETNFDSIRCRSWVPFEEVVLAFLTTLEENKKIALFEKRKTLLEYQSLCSRLTSTADTQEDYANALSIQKLKPTP